MAEENKETTTTAAGTEEKAKGGEKEKEKPKKFELTQDELDARIKAAAEAVEKKHADAREREAKEAEKKKLEAEGKHQERADLAERERDDARLHARKLEIKGDLTDYLAEKHPEYVKCAKYVMPLLDFDLKTDSAELRKQMKEAADQYVKDNPRAAGAGAPPSPGRGNLPKGTVEPKEKEGPPPRAPYMTQI